MSASSEERRSMENSGLNTKPFTPEEANNIVMSLKRPAVISNMVFDWPMRHWNAHYLSEKLKGKKMRFRIGKKNADTDVQFETHCSYVEATLEQFLAWNCRNSVFPSPFSPFDSSTYWAYADYKYMAMLLDNNADMFQDVVWADFGFPERNGRDSTLWIGTLGANTPCHVDSYGCNLVVQVQGRKRWHLFPPEDTSFLYPTRIPFEESSIFSKVNVVKPDWKSFPQFRKARAHVVTLLPGEVLLVPRHWWHYVESVDPITVSVNSWIELDEDHESRVEEAITRMLVCAIKSTQDPGNTESWLNPTEAEATSHDTNLQFLNQAVAACIENRERGYAKDKLHSAIVECSPTASIKKRKLGMGDCVDDSRSLQDEPDCSTMELKHLKKMPAGLTLVPVLPHLEASTLHEESNPKSEGPLYQPEGGSLNTFPGTGKQSLMSANDKVLADQTVLDWSANNSPKAISTNEVLDCLVNPQVVSLMAHLLLERQQS